MMFKTYWCRPLICSNDSVDFTVSWLWSGKVGSTLDSLVGSTWLYHHLWLNSFFKIARLICIEQCCILRASPELCSARFFLTICASGAIVALMHKLKWNQVMHSGLADICEVSSILPVHSKLPMPILPCILFSKLTTTRPKCLVPLQLPLASWPSGHCSCLAWILDLAQLVLTMTCVVGFRGAAVAQPLYKIFHCNDCRIASQLVNLLQY